MVHLFSLIAMFISQIISSHVFPSFCLPVILLFLYRYFPVYFHTNTEGRPLKNLRKPIRLYFHSDVVAIQRAFVFETPCLQSSVPWNHSSIRPPILQSLRPQFLNSSVGNPRAPYSVYSSSIPNSIFRGWISLYDILYVSVKNWPQIQSSESWAVMSYSPRLKMGRFTG